MWGAETKKEASGASNSHGKRGGGWEEKEYTAFWVSRNGVFQLVSFFCVPSSLRGQRRGGVGGWVMIMYGYGWAWAWFIFAK